MPTSNQQLPSVLESYSAVNRETYLILKVVSIVGEIGSILQFVIVKLMFIDKLSSPLIVKRHLDGPELTTR